jgi:single-strand DNA-binding protein
MAKPRSLNRVMIIGNLTRDPQLREGKNNVKIASFGVATNTSWKDTNGGVQERAEFHNVVAFNKLAEICHQVLSVGMLVYLEGELRTRIREDETGKKHYYTNIKLTDMLLLDSKGKGGYNSENREPSADLSAPISEEGEAQIAGTEEEEFEEELF